MDAARSSALAGAPAACIVAGGVASDARVAADWAGLLSGEVARGGWKVVGRPVCVKCGGATG